MAAVTLRTTCVLNETSREVGVSDEVSDNGVVFVRMRTDVWGTGFVLGRAGGLRGTGSKSLTRKGSLVQPSIAHHR